MEHDFWHQRWSKGQIGFHQVETNAHLQKYWSDVTGNEAGSVFVPLCGKSLDLLWLQQQGHEVLGVELSQRALQDFFAENRLAVKAEQQGSFERFSAENVTLFCGDFFALGESELKGCRLVFDRAALVALPDAMRVEYANKMAELLSTGSKILLVTMEYPQELMSGPPFSVSESEVESLFSAHFEIEQKEVFEIPAKGELQERGLGGWYEKIYVLTRKED
ncbi:MAG: thiopurine S-methyltransferase [Gammaproteobacteria bacterium]|nr:thiopurine S-methyltransferase [Gammaproteobacteria bacterium]